MLHSRQLNERIHVLKERPTDTPESESQPQTLVAQNAFT